MTRNEGFIVARVYSMLARLDCCLGILLAPVVVALGEHISSKNCYVIGRDCPRKGNLAVLVYVSCTIKGPFGNHIFLKYFQNIFVSQYQPYGFNTCIEILCKLGAKLKIFENKVFELEVQP